MSEGEGYKRCSNKSCVVGSGLQPLSNFDKRKASPDGFASRCKSCIKQYRKDNKEKIAEREKIYKQKVKEKFLKDGVTVEYKSCSNKNCSQENPQHFSCFNNRNDRPGGLSSRCKTCTKQYEKDNKEKIAQRKKVYNKKNEETIKSKRKHRYEENKELFAEKGKKYREENREMVLEKKKKYYKDNNDKIRDYHLFRKFGITLENYNEMVFKQDNKCAICEQSFEYNLCVDHQHDSGKVRGLLCRNCNLVIGNAKEDIFVLQKAIEYLKENE